MQICNTCNKAFEKTQGNHFHAKCSKCAKRETRQRHPARYFWNNLRGNAKRRGKEFALYPFEAFELWLEGQGWQFGDGLTVDRVDHLEGYHFNNIQFLTRSENAIKGNNERQEPY